MTTTAVDHPVDTALAVTVTATEALPVVVTMMMIVVATARLLELVAPLMIIHPHVEVSRIHTVVTTHLTHMPMADLLTIAHHHGITHQENPRMIMSALVLVISKCLPTSNQIPTNQV
jgi:hypothetical protein